jgi:hypothetical protein
MSEDGNLRQRRKMKVWTAKPLAIVGIWPGVHHTHIHTHDDSASLTHSDAGETPGEGTNKNWKCGHPRGQRRSNWVEQGTRGHEIKENQNKYQVNITMIRITMMIIIIIIIQIINEPMAVKK